MEKSVWHSRDIEVEKEEGRRRNDRLTTGPCPPKCFQVLSTIWTDFIWELMQGPSSGSGRWDGFREKSEVLWREGSGVTGCGWVQTVLGGVGPRWLLREAALIFEGPDSLLYPLNGASRSNPMFPSRWLSSSTTKFQNYTMLKSLRDKHVREGLLGDTGCLTPHFCPEEKKN